MAAGQPNAAIARRRHLSEKTVRNYVSAVFTKLDVTDRAAAVVRAHRVGL
jgi:DNA-binding NarL/FixJ family response regulator